MSDRLLTKLKVSAATNQNFEESKMLDFLKVLWQQLRQPINSEIPLYLLVGY